MTQFGEFVDDFGDKHGKVGGENMKITSWTREERASCCSDGKDPLSDEVAKNCANGMNIVFR